MLTPEKVIPLLSNEDPDTRARARRYLVTAHDPAPATADDFWAAADKAPEDEKGAYLDRLGLVPQTENSLKRLLDELPNADPASADSLRRTLERLDFELLKANWETIRNSENVAEPVKQHLQARLDLANEPPEPLWDRMKTFLAPLQGKDFTEEAELEADRLIEAIARRPDLFRERVLSELRDPEVKDWTELFVVDLAGEMRLTDATDALIDKLRDEESDLLWEIATDALVHIGDENVVRRIKERFADEDDGVQIFASEILARIKRPESHAAVLDLLSRNGEDDDPTPLLNALVDLLPDDDQSFEVLRAAAISGDYDRRVVHLDEALLELASLLGRDFPEAKLWRVSIARKRAEWAMGRSNVDTGLQPMESFGTSALFTGPLRPGASAADGGAAVDTEAPAQRPKLKPFKRAAAKVGRNDPCPCGSGKKYKKCHGK